MNIGQVMRGMMGDAQSSDSKALELKVGQVVRGVIVSLSEDQQAVIQINGTQVRAKLETTLTPGQSTLLQVQPQSENGQLVMKTVDANMAQLTEESVKEWAKALALPDQQKWAGELIRDLKRDGMTLTKALSSQFQQAAEAKPPAADSKTWMQATAVAVKRGLPVTEATVGALRQALSGPPVHQLLQTLEQELGKWQGELEASGMSSDDSQGAGNPTDKTATKPALSTAQQAATRLQALLAEGADLMQADVLADDAPSSGVAQTSAAVVEEDVTATAGQSIKSVKQEAQEAPPKTLASDADSAEPTEHAEQTAGSKAQANMVGGLLKWLGVDHERLLAQSVLQDAQQNRPVEEGESVSVAPEGEAPEATQTTEGKPKEAFTAHGIERQGMPVMQDRLAVTGMTGQADLAGAAAKAQDLPNATDSMKSLLLTIASSDDVPAALKDSAQQLVQQITGQQLLLSPERNGSPFTHVTLFIPLKSPNGDQTASVHIQTRRGRKGELDADNCHLMFDLRMKSLGDTIVDVQVVDKIVSLKLWNDHPAIEELLESSRSEVTEALKQAGYQLLTLKATPMPDRLALSGQQETAAAAPSPVQSAYTSRPYKGVDYRI
ncbi:hypothetical protein FHS18_001425 [Paenibacillus phyllosphaerae]|uniref:Flagellar hook-length control protein FliK n=1 Tax=Paenibacillus phyllosphaerae TaxID=274593 RepID=A0A7W5AVC5_9BACL|nr:hypothetical protein [Paenibacillus phyllosphaerae]MBB3109373.1 hypothetical protein [Paenibacillus phyllosphaerae]